MSYDLYSHFKGGKIVYEGVTWAGYIGLLTGYKTGYFGVTIDEVSSGLDALSFVFLLPLLCME